ncbi:MAG: hypothetical protein KDD51_17025, partial [Bdellovibrionales bacterium]|nr:hypothetical protein [Bdellovibrionales bacterium]
MKRFPAIFALACLFGRLAYAGSISENFSTVTKNETGTSTGVWNAARGVLHVPHVVDRSDDGGEDDSMSIGNGTDGAFDNSTYSNFDTDAPATPTEIKLDSSRTYQFTSFTLDAGYTVTGTSVNTPLTIRVQGDMQVSGTIDLNGQSGTQVSLTNTETPAGGTACCGGGAGGAGGQGSSASTGSNGTSGDVGAGDLGKGLGGTASSSGVVGQGAGGGGGGGHANYVALTNDGENGAGGAAGGKGGGNAGNYDDVYISNFYGGSGGAGGGGYNGNAAANSDSS